MVSWTLSKHLLGRLGEDSSGVDVMPSSQAFFTCTPKTRGIPQILGGIPPVLQKNHLPSRNRGGKNFRNTSRNPHKKTDQGSSCQAGDGFHTACGSGITASEQGAPTPYIARSQTHRGERFERIRGGEEAGCEQRGVKTLELFF